MANLADIGDVAAFLQLPIETEAKQAAVQRALEEATAAIRNYCNQFIELVEDDEITLDVRPGQRKLFLPELPVIEVSEVVENEETLTVTDHYKLGQHGILHRVGGGCWYSGIQSVTVTYSHGYDNIPDDIVGVCTRAAARAYQAGLKAADAEGVPGISSKSLGDFSVAFNAEGNVMAGEAVLGASAARMLLMSEKEILDKYRLKGT
jgi:hypothetical protein